MGVIVKFKIEHQDSKYDVKCSDHKMFLVVLGVVPVTAWCSSLYCFGQLLVLLTFLDTHRHFRLAIEIPRIYRIVCGDLQHNWIV